MLEILLKEYRTHRWARFTAWISAYGAALWVVDHLTHATSDVRGLLWFIFWACALVAGLYYLARLWRVIRSRLLWRLRRRLVVAYILIGVVPISLILVLVFLGAFIINGQFAAFLVVLRLRDHFDEIEQVNRVVLHEARYGGEKSPPALLARIRSFYVTELVGYTKNYPGLIITLHLGGETRSFLLDGKPAVNPAAVPSWVKGEEYANIVTDQGQLALRSVERTVTPAGDLTLVLSQPFSPELMELVGDGIGPVGVVITKQAEPRAAESARIRVDSSGATYVQSNSINSKSVKLPDPVNPFDFVVFGASSLDPILWGGDREEKAGAPAFVYVSSRIFALNSRLLATLGDYSEIYVYTFKGVAIVFLLIEGAALLIGIRMTRSMTRAVDTLYDATERVKAGDFSYRTNFPSHDQLTALGEAFDSMTASVERLMQESQERLRLQSELDIAREVQRQLFPQSVPKVPGLDLFGICKAARSVSGDYYDFLKLDEHRVGLVLGDVSGKGISAALLMAAIQSALRAQFYDGLAGGQPSTPTQLSTARVVDRLNRQIYANTPLEKYVTFFFAVYDARTRNLSYTNAGHLPPILFRDGKIERLRTGGTVVGLFPSAAYEVGEIRLEPHDLLLAYTDGITEPENTYGEEFGESRLLEVMRGMLNASPEVLATKVYRSVDEWTGSPELQDDMTLVLARAG
ncbi:MAG: SpoIIE family protein phosphatase [Terriglobia bacterium]|jgi:sigma-B regulation protein RsbU (phosphoserine phosphatase)